MNKYSANQFQWPKELNRYNSLNILKISLILKSSKFNKLFRHNNHQIKRCKVNIVIQAK